jgi:hypothetical protein
MRDVSLLSFERPAGNGSVLLVLGGQLELVRTLKTP